MSSKVTVAEATSTTQIQIKELINNVENVHGLAYCLFLKVSKIPFKVNPDLDVDVVDGDNRMSFTEALNAEVRLAEPKAHGYTAIIFALTCLDNSIGSLEKETNQELLSKWSARIKKYLETLKLYIVVDGKAKLLDDHIMNCAIYSRLMKIYFVGYSRVRGMVRGDVQLVNFTEEFEDMERACQYINQRAQ